ncbi:hypothetical protein DMI62_00340 [Escherichia coli]|nr:hypothetical protein [Escherichia coli]
MYAMQIQRYQQAVRSTMVLSLTELISKISLKKAFQSKYFRLLLLYLFRTIKLTIILQTL